MTLSVKYHQWVASLLLALYGFITVPVQLWHHHISKATLTVSSKKSSFATVSKSTVARVEDCKICSHSYSVFAHDHAAIEIGITNEPIFSAASAVPALPDHAPAAFSNKGPPAYFRKPWYG